ncbi:hypothetical protein FB451DRAFT_1309914 [Mycena latifolia]|nr:hypothetical protein FB451DRAFT_1309914 [Mycena latifolia]
MAQTQTQPQPHAPPRTATPVARAGPVRRPEPSLSALAVDAPLPALYECQTPASMAKMIMSRHTYRRPAPPAARRAAPPV